MSYFSNFPTTIYNGVEALDITRRAKISKIVKDSALAYMSYTIPDGDRPEDVAYYYYDDPSLAWLVLMSNDIIDPYPESFWLRFSCILGDYFRNMENDFNTCAFFFIKFEIFKISKSLNKYVLMESIFNLKYNI